MRRRLLACASFLVLSAGLTGFDRQDAVSSLWPDGGRSFVPQQPLADFSYAGYMRGEAPLPQRAPEVSVLDFGATPDDDSDDTEAFAKALADSPGKCIGVPAGTYVLSDRLTIDRSGTVLKGEGSGKTILHFTRGLEEIEPRASRTGHGSQTTAWSWSGGLIRMGLGGSPATDPRARLSSTSERGTHLLHLADHGFATGDELLIEAREVEDGSLARYLYRGDVRESDTDIANLRVSQVARVVSVDGGAVEIDRPLRFEARPEWVTVSRFAPGVVECGVEGLTIDFPARQYRGHFEEDGLNGVAVGNAAHSWVRDVEIVNADSGIFVRGHFITLDGIVIRTDREGDRAGMFGHHAIETSGTDNLVTNFDIRTRFIHDLTITRGSVGNVFASGRGDDLSMDHHRWAPYQNLFTDLDTGDGRRYFASGGTRTRGRHTAAGAVFWNIRGARPAKMPGSDFGPTGIFFVGVKGLSPEDARDGWHVEAIEPEALEPANLYAAQLQRRLAQEAAGDRPPG